MPPSILVALIAFHLALPQAAAQSGRGANTGGAANTVEGTGRGAGGPGDGQGPGQGAGQGLGPGGRDKVSPRGSSASQQTGGGGANTGGAANTVEGTGRGAGGPGDGQGPGQGAGQGLGPGGREKDRAEKEKAEKERQNKERQEKERAEKKRAERERQERERQEKERADQERAEKEKADKEREEHQREEKERAERERADKERADREREQREKEETDRREREEKERADKERADKEREEKERSDREREETERTEREEKQREERDRPETEEREDVERPDRPDPEPEDRPGRTGDEQPEREAGTRTEPPPGNGGEDVPRGEEERPRESSERTPDDIPTRRDPGGERLLPDSPSRDVVPGADNIPGASDADRALRSLTDPAAARDGFFGFLFGGRRAAPAVEEPIVSAGKGVLAADRSTRVRRSRGAFLGIFRLEAPDLASAAKVQLVQIDPRVTSPRTLTYKSRLSRISRWIGPLTLGLLNYVPFETMNAAVSGRMNNLMAEEKISVEEMAARVFAENLSEGKRFTIGSPPEAFVELEITRYALDPVPTSVGRMKPTVSLTGRMYGPTGRLLWIGKGFSTIAERGIKGATVEQYESSPAALRADFDEAVQVASRRLAMQVNALPRAKLTVLPQGR